MIATGILRKQHIGSTLLIIFCVSFFVSTLLVTNSFVYRYLQLCRTQFFQALSSTKYWTLGSIVNGLLLVDYCIVIFVVTAPRESIEYFVRNTVVIPGVDINDTSYLGLSIKHSGNPLHIAFIANLVLVIVMLTWTNIYCARSIAVFLRKAARHRNTLTLQRQMFTLLLLQAAGPLFFAQLPFFLAVFLLCAGIDTSYLITNLIDVMISLLPLLNPILILAFLRDYRNFVLIKLRIKRQPHPGTFTFMINKVPEARSTTVAMTALT
ncbi:7TM chemoreceptor [Trichostrongylus colubriformis]|uniref:7TM chemoreceptor n=1 Tax=Trichostrongylus colubriformis TaxID=6319 RepID=A0AAN8FK81_TRICO